MPDDRCDLLCLDLPKAERLRSERLCPDLARALSGQAKALSDPTTPDDRCRARCDR